MGSAVDGGTTFGILNAWNPRWWRNFVQAVLVVLALGLATDQQWAMSAVEHGFNWLVEQERELLQPMVDSIITSINERQAPSPP